MKVQRVFSRETKLEVVRRYLSGEAASILAQLYSIRPTLVHQWVSVYRREGAGGLREAGRPSHTERLGEVVRSTPDDDLADPLVVAERKIALLERKLAQQSLELDFFKDALPLLERSHPATSRAGEKMSMPSSTGGHRGKARD
jgi:transposase-like protein